MNSILDTIFSPTFKPVKCLQRQFSAFDYTGVPIGGHNSDGKGKTAEKRQKRRLCNKTVKENNASVEIRLSDLNRKSELKKLAQFKTSGYRVVRLDDYYESLSLPLDENDNVIKITNERAKQSENGDLDDSMEADGSFLEDATFQPEIAKVESLNELSFEHFDSKTLQRLDLNLQEVDASPTIDHVAVTPNSDNLNTQEQFDCESRIPTGEKLLHQNENPLNEKDVQSIKIQQNTDIVSVTNKDSQLTYSKEVFETSASGTNFEIYIDVDCDIEKAKTFDEPDGNTLSPDSAYGTEQAEHICVTDTIEKLNNKCFSDCHHSDLTDDLSLTRENDQAAQSFLCNTKVVGIVKNNENKAKKSGKSQKVEECRKEKSSNIPSETKGDKKKQADKTKKSDSVLNESVTNDDGKLTHEKHKFHYSDTCKVKQKHVKDGKTKPKKDDVSENNSVKIDVKSTSKAVTERIEIFKSGKLNQLDDDINKENIKISCEQEKTKGKMEGKSSSKENGKYDNKHVRVRGKHLDSDQANSERNTIQSEVEYMRKHAIKTVQEKLIEKDANTSSVEKKNSEMSTNKVERCLEQGVERSNQAFSKPHKDPKQKSSLQKKEEDIDKRLKKSNEVNDYISNNKDKTSLTEKIENGKGERNLDKHNDKIDCTETDKANHRKGNNSEKYQDDVNDNYILKRGSYIKEKEVIDTKIVKEMKDNMLKAQKHEEKSNYSAGKVVRPSDLSNQQKKKNMKTSKQTDKQSLNIENKNLDNMEDARSSKQSLSKPDREQESNRLLQNEHGKEKKLQHSGASKDFITKNNCKTSSSEVETVNRYKKIDNFNRTAIGKDGHRKDKFSQKLLDVSGVSSIVIQSSGTKENGVKESLSKGQKHEENKHYLDNELICPSDLTSKCLQPKENTTHSKPTVKKSLSTESKIKKKLEDFKNVTFHSENNIPRKYLECFVMLTDCRAKEDKPVNQKKRKLSSTDLIEKTAKKRVIQWLEQHTSETVANVLQDDSISKPPITKMNFKIPKRSNTTGPRTCKYCKNISFETSERLHKHVKKVHREKRKRESRYGYSSSNSKERRVPEEGKQRKSSLDKYVSKYDRDRYVLKTEIQRFRSERRHSKSRESDRSSSLKVKHDSSRAKRSSSKEKGTRENNVLIEIERKENCKSSKSKREVNKGSFRDDTDKRREHISDSDTSLTKPGQCVNTEKYENKQKTNKSILHDGGSTAVKNKPTSNKCKITTDLFKPNDEKKQDLSCRDNIKENITEDRGSKKDLKQEQNKKYNSGEHGGIKSHGNTVDGKEESRDGVERVKVSQADDISTKSGNFKIPIMCNLCEKSYFTNKKEYKRHMCSKHSDRSDKIHTSSDRVKVTPYDKTEELIEKRCVVNITLSQSDQSGKCKENANGSKIITNNLNNFKLRNSENNLNKDNHMEINVQTVGDVPVQTSIKQEEPVKSRLSLDVKPPVKSFEKSEIATERCDICQKILFSGSMQRHFRIAHFDEYLTRFALSGTSLLSK